MSIIITLVPVLAFTEPQSEAKPVGADILSGNLCRAEAERDQQRAGGGS